MKLAYIAAALATAAGTLGPVACTTETITQQGPPSEAGAGDAAELPNDDAVAAGDAGDGATGDGKIGTRSDKGDKSVDVNISTHSSYDCNTVCKAAGGTCEAGQRNGVGYVNRKYNDGSGTIGYQITGCGEPEAYASSSTTMTSMICYCSQMAVAPTVRVRKAEGLFACSKVCASWSLTCSEKRSQYSYSDEDESSSTKLDCAAAPAAATHHYLCSCDI